MYIYNRFDTCRPKAMLPTPSCLLPSFLPLSGPMGWWHEVGHIYHLLPGAPTWNQCLATGSPGFMDLWHAFLTSKHHLKYTQSQARLRTVIAFLLGQPCLLSQLVPWVLFSKQISKRHLPLVPRHVYVQRAFVAFLLGQLCLLSQPVPCVLFSKQISKRHLPLVPRHVYVQCAVVAFLLAQPCLLSQPVPCVLDTKRYDGIISEHHSTIIPGTPTYGHRLPAGTASAVGQGHEGLPSSAGLRQCGWVSERLPHKVGASLACVRFVCLKIH